MLHANFVVLSPIEPELLPIEILHCGNRDFRPFWLLWPWPWPDDLHIRTWPVIRGDTWHVQIWSSSVKAIDNYRLTDSHTYRLQTDTTKTSRIVINCLIIREPFPYPFDLFPASHCATDASRTKNRCATTIPGTCKQSCRFDLPLSLCNYGTLHVCVLAQDLKLASPLCDINISRGLWSSPVLYTTCLVL